ncbi:MATE family efflux transporter [Butyrivibrio sp. YAB3001]|uniref:MATE family efflux transporter n=1 Tax=Butyrivibrio sp. YAB3001 TaxID=1520812 RepID=UPI0008F66973|nr:MATE family efflux transporter [Butyrivibrio sp. YAB3001]SFC86842.1 putative efflux protein, MATE family [Butyrivibrio sp. YAB3001]
MIFVRDKKFYKTLIAFALPIALQQLITVGVNMADNIMLGQLGEAPMSGATLANNFISIFQIMCMGLGMGASVLVSRFFGMKDKISMKKAVNIMFRLLFLVASAFALATALFPAKIMGLFTTESDVIIKGTGYLLISIPCYYLNGFAMTSSIMLRSVGKANIPLLSSICSFFINIFFNWVFIFGKLGAPEMGVNGAALGTLIARIVEFTVIMGFLFFVDKNIELRLKDLSIPVKDLIPEYIRISIPVLVSDTLLGLGNSAVAVIMGHIGASFVAANSITTVVMQLSTVVIQGICQASCTITGITLGKGEVEKAKQQGYTFAALGFIIGGFGCALILLLSNIIVDAYKIEPETAVLAKDLMHAVALVIWFQAANSILTKGTLRGGGDTKFLMVADIIFLWVCSIPLGALTGLVLKWPGFWVYIMLKIDQFIKCIVCVIRLRSGKWIKKIQRKDVA